MILVVGATGFLGSSICQLLAQEGRSVRAVVRPTSDPGRVKALRNMGAELVEADLKDPASLDRACQRVDTVISTATTTLRDQQADPLPAVDHQGQLDLVEAARQAGVRHFVYISYPNTLDGEELSPLGRGKRAVEQQLMRSGMTYTVLQPGVFMEVWLSPVLGFDHPNATARVLGNGEQPIGWISLMDVARFAAASLEQNEAQNAVLPLAAENLSMNGVIRLFEEASGRTFEAQHVPVEALRAQQAAASTPLDQSFASLMLNLAQGALIEPDPRQQSLGIPLTTVREYAQRVAVPTATA